MLVETFIFELWNMSVSVRKQWQFVSDKAGRLELNHLSLPLLLSSQLKVFGSLDGMLKSIDFIPNASIFSLSYLVLPLALGALEPQHQLLGGLRLLPQDGLGLTTETLLFTVVPGCTKLEIELQDFRIYLLLPWACLDSADFLYWVTLNSLWDKHLGWGQ